MAAFRRVERAAGRILSDQMKKPLGQLYNRGRTIKANHEYDPTDINATAITDSPQHIILIVVDALRYDYLSTRTAPFFSNKRPTEAVAPSTWTFPSVSSMLTGLYPHEHGAMRQIDAPDNVTEEEIKIPVLASEKQTLTEVLGGAGIATYGGFGFGMPFLALRSRFHKHRLYRDADAEHLLADHRSWITDNDGRRTFSYLHLSDLHTPHHPPKKYIDDFDVNLSIDRIKSWKFTDQINQTKDAQRYQEQKVRLYRASLRYVDDAISAYYDELKSKFGSNLLVFVTADHGEGFWDHASFDAETFYDSRPAYCVGHGGTPYECVTRVPLWVDGIENKNTGLTSLIDITPTILEILGLKEELEPTGTPLTRTNEEDRHVLTEGIRYGYEKKAIYKNGWKIIKSPSEEANVETTAQKEPEEVFIPAPIKRKMVDNFPSWTVGKKDTAKRVSGTVEQRLRDLGYQ